MINIVWRKNLDQALSTILYLCINTLEKKVPPSFLISQIILRANKARAVLAVALCIFPHSYFNSSLIFFEGVFIILSLDNFPCTAQYISATNELNSLLSPPLPTLVYSKNVRHWQN